MKLKKIVLLMTVAMLSIVNPPQTHAQGKTMLGMPDCGNWLTNQDNRYGYQWALVGFLSALNSITTADSKQVNDTLGKTTAPKIFLWMDKYCKENPLNATQQGAFTLHNELINKK